MKSDRGACTHQRVKFIRGLFPAELLRFRQNHGAPAEAVIILDCANTGGAVATDANDPGLFTALKDELGLELNAEKSPIEVIVVQAISEPTLD